MTTNLLDFDLDGLAAFCERLGEKRFRATQLFRWIHQRGASDFDQMSDLAKSLREKLRGCAHVAGLQAIATAKRLGAVIEASDVRPAVKEQIESLGAKFVDVAYE
ncbi:MAG: hypothetical protein ACN6N5_14175, partial [Diaphorobacter nitroreducens]